MIALASYLSVKALDVVSWAYIVVPENQDMMTGMLPYSYRDVVSMDVVRPTDINSVGNQ